eukprot:GCRY01003745.1.p1 GENE.GCRY01003745.1~~GCRY01003745.1.p1  ORF type:complete len:281 (-),score=24.65 GCRY01003745.1:41-766(-)
MTVEKLKLLILDMSDHKDLLPEGKWTSDLLDFEDVTSSVFSCANDDEWPDFDLFVSRHWDAVAVTGSFSSPCDSSRPWHASILRFLKAAIKNNIPTFGICYGAQMLAYAAFGPESVRSMTAPEFGIKNVHLQNYPENALFRGVKSPFLCAVCHTDCFERSPSCARTKEWDFHAFRVENTDCWGVQFHPEIKGADLISMLKSLNISTAKHESDKTDEQAAKKIARNFVQLTWANKLKYKKFN